MSLSSSNLGLIPWLELDTAALPTANWVSLTALVCKMIFGAPLDAAELCDEVEKARRGPFPYVPDQGFVDDLARLVRNEPHPEPLNKWQGMARSRRFLTITKWLSQNQMNPEQALDQVTRWLAQNDAKFTQTSASFRWCYEHMSAMIETGSFALYGRRGDSHAAIDQTYFISDRYHDLFTNSIAATRPVDFLSIEQRLHSGPGKDAYIEIVVPLEHAEFALQSWLAGETRVDNQPAFQNRTKKEGVASSVRKPKVGRASQRDVVLAAASIVFPNGVSSIPLGVPLKDARSRVQEVLRDRFSVNVSEKTIAKHWR